jgi:hypothetical protein
MERMERTRLVDTKEEHVLMDARHALP